jgi:CRISPR-associated protein Csm2
MNHNWQNNPNPERGRYSGQKKQNSGDRNSKSQESKWKRELQQKWITDGLDENAIKFAEDFGKDLAYGLTTNQIRNFFGEVRRIQQKGVLSEKTSFLLLRPKLAYAAKRAGSTSANDFKEVMEKAHKIVMEVENNDEEFEKRFKNYVDLLEAILAYHKAYGGK